MTTLRICFVGDSIMLGTADDDCLGWPGRLCARQRQAGHDISYYNLGVRGETSAMIAERWRAECEPRLPEPSPGALVFGFGTNDSADMEGTGRRMEQEDSLATARAIMTEAKAWKPVLWIGPVPADEAQLTVHVMPGVTYIFNNQRLADLNSAFTTLAAELDIPYLDLFTPLGGDARWQGAYRQGDGVHPTDGYDLMAGLVADWAPMRAWFED